MSSTRDVDRLRLGLHQLTTTSLGPSYNLHQYNEPISAISMSSSHLPSTAQTPSSAIQPYNPQEWVASPAPIMDRQQHYAVDPQVSSPPPPPPPYSPPRSQQPRPVSNVFDQPPASTSTPPPPRIPSTNFHRPSPEPTVNQSFPPPPGGGGRGSSRERRFGLPSFGRRKESDQHPATPEAHRQVPAVRQSMGPGSYYSPELMRPISTVSNGSQNGPPAARRAVSAGAVETPTSARSRSGSQTRFEAGMAIPPPPPGPPPSSSRSQSVQSMDRTTVPIISPPTRRPRPALTSSLGPVPPTPADWVDENAQGTQQNRNYAGLTIDTETAQNAEHIPEPPTSSSSASALSRAKAVRHDKTIIQRRTESRTRHGIRGSIDERTQPSSIADIVVPSGSSSGPSRHLKLTPKSAGGSRYDTPQTGESSGQADSRNSTPRIGSARNPHPHDAETPPFSPFPAKMGHRTAGSTSVVPKSLPTPPPQVRSAASSNPRDASRPPASMSVPVSKHLVVTQSAEQFAAGAIERYQVFAATEATAGSDAERVRLFADFMVNESRIRRERYSAAIGAMGSEIFDLTRDLFRPMLPARRTSAASQDEWTPDSSEPTRSQRGSFGAIPPVDGGSSSAPGSGRLPPSPNGTGPNAGVTSNFMPSLSPILSMSVSGYGDGSSRGRPPSRWWETDSQGDPSRRFERSKRESKYMGVPKDQWAEEEPVQPSHGTTSEQDSSSDYPPEKTGWHDPREEAVITPQPLQLSTPQAGFTPSPAPRKSEYLDVSRLVTLPPPYPRHHPAVNNNHPELASIRSSVRILSDLSEVSQVKEKFALDSSKRRDEFDKAAVERRQALRANLQQEINAGNIGYADAGAIEADAKIQENEKKKELEKSEYEHFQNQVIMPINDLLTGRITRATELHDDLSRRLFTDGETDIDMPQEEGDDRPELLEKLTLLKWIFEARETLHRAIYDILSDRNDRFREVVVTPYRLAGNTEKVKNAEAFFQEDAAKREYAFANEVLDRARDFRTVIDSAVQRGVALQLSAFWDIAPPLAGLLDNIPQNLEGFNIQIPPSEYEENPAYREHPMQYLLTLLHHTQKSTYQFIEAHTNLLCLLHEAKEAVVHAKSRVLATQVEDADGTPVCADERDERARSMRQSEERRLTEDLKEKVRVVQDQWNNALAESIGNVKERIGAWLLETGGWDETLIEGEDGIAAV